jgi:PrcB C-terminal
MYPLVVLILLVGGLTLGACESSSNPKEPREAITAVDPVAVVLHTGYSGFDASERFVVRDSARWADAWATAMANYTPIPPLPVVNFEKDMIIVAALGARPSGGYDIAIEGVAPESDGALVLVGTTAPGSDCITTAAITAPVVMIRVPSVAGRIRFQERAEVRSCGGAEATR